MKYPSWLTRLPDYDKWLHAIGCLLLYAIFRWLLDATVFDAVLGIIFIAAIKELVIDLAMEEGAASWGDFFAGIIPVCVVVVFETFKG